jgi:hypothetical protein
VTFNETIRVLRGVKDRTTPALEAALTTAAVDAVPLVRSEWPHLSGDSGRAFRAGGTVISNAERHTPFVHGGLAFRLVPAVLDRLAPQIVEDVNNFLAFPR